MKKILNDIYELAWSYYKVTIGIFVIIGMILGAIGTTVYMDNKVVRTHGYHVDYVQVCDKNLYDVTAVDKYNWKGDIIGTDYY